ncbi:hypothetical protein EV1_023893 [Malus domestica]
MRRFARPFNTDLVYGSGSIYWGKQIHGHVIRNAIELTALVDLYGKTGCLTSAGYVFKKMVVKEVCTWNAMISALSLNGLFWEAAAVIKSMPFEPDASMLGAILGSCKIHGTAEMGNEVGKKLLELQPQHCGRYVARKAMVDAGIRKISAYNSDMFINNPNIMFHAMCTLLGSENETKNAFAQFLQIFYDRLKDDPFGDQMVVLYGREDRMSKHVSKSIEAAHRVGDREYEYGTKKGGMEVRINNRIYPHLAFQSITKVGSLLFASGPPAFLGCVPTGGPSFMTQLKTWAPGLLEILLSKNCPYLALYLQTSNLGYSWLTSWSFLGSYVVIAELCYAALPAYSIITNTHLLPQVCETVFEVTKDQSSSSDEGSEDTEAGRFPFEKSPIFVPPTTILLVQ